MTDILFIQPWDRPWTDSNTVKQRKTMYMSRAQFEVGVQIPEEFSVAFLDLNLALKQGDSIKSAIGRNLMKHEPRIVFISMPTFALGDQVGKIVGMVKRKQKNAKIILGGSALSLIKDLPLKWWREVDACYDGYGQEIPDLICRCLRGGVTVPRLYQKGFSFCDAEKRMIDNYSPEALYTANNRLDFAEYLTACRRAGIRPMGVVEMSRGCRFNCSFCALNNNNLGFSSRSPETVIRETYFLAQHGIRYIHIIDPTFGLDRINTSVLLKGLVKFHDDFPEIGVEVLTRPEIVTSVFGEALRKAGIVRCGIGMETMGKKELASVSKSVNPLKTLEAIRILADNGIETKLFHILFPNSFSEETIRFLLRLSQKNLPFIMQTSFLRDLARPDSSDNFIDHDQTVFNVKTDTPEQIMEWMAVNLAFPSMDVGKNGDGILLEKLRSVANNNGSLKKLFKIKTDPQEIWLKSVGRDYVYLHKNGLPMSSCIFTT